MKNRIFKAALSVLALIMIVTISYAFVSKTKKNSPKGTSTIWYFTGTLSQVQNSSFWTTSNPNDPNCGQGANVPCQLTVDASNSSQLQTYLNAHTVPQIKAAADALKP